MTQPRKRLPCPAVAAIVVGTLALGAWLLITWPYSPAHRFEAWTDLSLPWGAKVNSFRDSVNGPFGVDGDLAVCVEVDPQTMQRLLAATVFSENVPWSPGPVDADQNLSQANIPTAILQSPTTLFAQLEGPNDEYRILVADPQTNSLWLWAVWW